MELYLSRKNIAIGLALVIVLSGFVYLYKYRLDTAAYVNGERILIAPINKRIEILKSQDPNRFNGPGGAAEETRLKRMLLEDRVAEKMISQAAAKAGVKISDDEVNQAINELSKPYKDKAAFSEQLDKEGISDDILKDITRDQIAALKIRVKLANETTITQTEIDDYVRFNRREFEQPSPQVLLGIITVDQATDADKVVNDLNQGIDFDKVASRRSPGKKSELGWQLESFLDSAALKAVQPINLGAHTTPIPNPDNTLSIYKLQDRQVRKSTEAEMQTQARAKLLRDAQQRSFNTWFDEIEKAANIQTYI